MFTSDKKTHPAVYMIILIIPFLFFFWMAPFVTNLTIGNDYYQGPSIQQQMELQFSIKRGSFPLYAPGFALGHSSNAMTLAQVYHPISYIASLLPGYWSGKALQLNTLLKLLFLGLTQIALFAFLRRIKINVFFSFILSCLAVYNLRMLDLFRYGAALEAYSAHLMLCTSIGWYFTAPSKRLGPLSIIFFTYLLVSSGHPQMMYYGLLGSVLFAIICPFFISVMLNNRDINSGLIFRFWLRIGLYLSLGVLLSSAYILPYYFDFIALNTARVGQGYEWANSYGDTFIGTLNSFFLPFRSDIHGNFAGSSLFLMAILLPVLRCFRVKIPRIIWLIWAIIIFIFLHMQGDRTPVHYLVWKYMPLASSFRIAGRISLIMPIFIMLLLAWAIQIKPLKLHFRKKLILLKPFVLLAIVSLLVMAVYYFSTAFFVLSFSKMPGIGYFTPVSIREIPLWAEFAVILCAIGTLAVLVFQGLHSASSKFPGIIFCLLICVHIILLLVYGTWIVEKHDDPSFSQIVAQKKDSINYIHHPGSGFYSSVVQTQVEQSFMEPFLAKIYMYGVEVSGMDNVYQRMRNERIPQQVFVERFQQGKEFLLPVSKIFNENAMVELTYSSFNRLQFSVFSSTPAFLGLSYPYTNHWKALTNGREVPIYRINGTAQGVPVPEGKSIVEFRYWSPSAYWGMIISCISFSLIGVYFSCRSHGVLVRALSVLIVITIGLGIFIIWKQSLYSGDNLETQYMWTYKPPLHSPNLAYGKKTWIDPAHPPNTLLRFDSSKAIDGNRSPKSGFITSKHENPSWTIDLNRRTSIKKILLYESINDSSANIRPLEILISFNGKQWNTVSSVSSKANDFQPIKIIFETPHSARYVKIKAAGYCRLALDEVEMYSVEDSELKNK